MFLLLLNQFNEHATVEFSRSEFAHATFGINDDVAFGNAELHQLFLHLAATVLSQLHVGFLGTRGAVAGTSQADFVTTVLGSLGDFTEVDEVLLRAEFIGTLVEEDGERSADELILTIDIDELHDGVAGLVASRTVAKVVDFVLKVSDLSFLLAAVGDFVSAGGASVKVTATNVPNQTEHEFPVGVDSVTVRSVELIIAPTREGALQINVDVKVLADSEAVDQTQINSKFKSVLVVARERRPEHATFGVKAQKTSTTIEVRSVNSARLVTVQTIDDVIHHINVKVFVGKVANGGFVVVLARVVVVTDSNAQSGREHLSELRGSTHERTVEFKVTRREVAGLEIATGNGAVNEPTLREFREDIILVSFRIVSTSKYRHGGQ